MGANGNHRPHPRRHDRRRPDDLLRSLLGSYDRMLRLYAPMTRTWRRSMSKQEQMREAREQEQRQRCAAVVAEFYAGNTDATMQAMAGAILEYRRRSAACGGRSRSALAAEATAQQAKNGGKT